VKQAVDSFTTLGKTQRSKTIYCLPSLTFGKAAIENPCQKLSLPKGAT